MTNADNPPKPNRDPRERGTPHGRWFGEEQLAMLLLRLLGVYFVGCAIVSGVRATGFLSVDWRFFDTSEWLIWADVVSLVRAAAELIAGISLRRRRTMGVR